MAAQILGITKGQIATVEHEELGVPMPASMEKEKNRAFSYTE